MLFNTAAWSCPSYKLTGMEWCNALKVTWSLIDWPRFWMFSWVVLNDANWRKLHFWGIPHFEFQNLHRHTAFSIGRQKLVRSSKASKSWVMQMAAIYQWCALLIPNLILKAVSFVTQKQQSLEFGVEKISHLWSDKCYDLRQIWWNSGSQRFLLVSL